MLHYFVGYIFLMQYRNMATAANFSNTTAIAGSYKVFHVLVLLATLLREKISTLADSTPYFGQFYYLLIHIVGVFC